MKAVCVRRLYIANSVLLCESTVLCRFICESPVCTLNILNSTSLHTSGHTGTGKSIIEYICMY